MSYSPPDEYRPSEITTSLREEDSYDRMSMQFSGRFSEADGNQLHSPPDTDRLGSTFGSNASSTLGSPPGAAPRVSSYTISPQGSTTSWGAGLSVSGISGTPSPRMQISPEASPRAPPPRQARETVEERLRKGLVVGVDPDGARGTLADLRFYLENNHVLLSSCCAHASHPSPPHRRRLVLLNSLAFAFFVACMVVLAGRCKATGRCPQEARGVAAALREMPMTVSVLLQLLWDLASSSLGVCPCARQGPEGLRKPCSYAMLCCVIVSQLGVVFGASGALLLLLFGPSSWLSVAKELAVLLGETKLLALALALPVGALVFLALRHHELGGVAPLYDHARLHDEEEPPPPPPSRQPSSQPPPTFTDKVGWKNCSTSSVPTSPRADLW